MPQHLPDTYTKMNSQELLELGFIEVPDKPIVGPGMFVEWTGSEWIQRPANLTELSFKWQEIRDIRKTMLEQADIEVMKFVEINQQVPTELATYKQQLRDITLQEDPWHIVWPTYK